MGIDPVTHEPLNKENDQQNSQSEQSEEKQQMPAAAVPFAADETSYSPTDQNSSSDESNVRDNNLYENDPLISCLFRDDPPQIDFPWEFPSPEESLAASSWDQGCQWLLDCQDFGVHDFGFECFNDGLPFGVGSEIDGE